MISVIVLAYNGEKYIRQCLDSVVNQTIGMENIELIIIDDVSTDSTVEILKEYEQKYSENICLILREVNSQKAGEVNRNLGVEYAQGEYIMFLDQDDWYEPNALEILQDFMEKDSELDYIEYKFRRVSEDGKPMYGKRYQNNEFYVYEISDETVRTECAKSGVLPGASFAWTKIYRKSFLIENNIKHNDGAEKTGFSDNFFSGMVVMYCRKIGKLQTPLYNYRNYHGSYSHDGAIKTQFERCKSGIVFWDECERRGILERNYDMAEYLFSRTFLLKTFWKFLMEFESIPYDILVFIQKEMKERCPGYKENEIMKGSVEMQMVFAPLDCEFSKDFLMGLRQQIREQIEAGSDVAYYMYL